MKFVKFGIFALSLGLFVASCGESTTSEETTATDSATLAPAPEATVPTTMDTATAPSADTSMGAGATGTTTDTAAHTGGAH